MWCSRLCFGADDFDALRDGDEVRGSCVAAAAVSKAAFKALQASRTGADARRTSVPGGAEVVAATRGKDKAWNALTSSEAEAATELGLNAETWDDPTQPWAEAGSYRWSDLPERHQKAAMVLGYDAALWDEEVEQDFEAEVPEAIP